MTKFSKAIPMSNLFGAGEQGLHSGESTRLPPMWPGFDSRTWCHVWVEFVVGSHPCSKRFLSGFPLSSITNNFQIPIRFVGCPHTVKCIDHLVMELCAIQINKIHPNLPQ